MILKKLSFIGLISLFSIQCITYAQVDSEYQKSQSQTDATQNISLEDIWKTYEFYGKTVSGLRSTKDGNYYTVIEKAEEANQLSKYKYADGQLEAVLLSAEDLRYNDKQLKISSYQFSADEQKVLIATEKESIYRRSWKAKHYVVDLQTKAIQELSQGKKEMYATFSPNGEMVAYVVNNNLYYKDTKTNTTHQVTKDGEYNKIINGASDWVYEEELELSKAFEWSPKGSKIAFYRFDEGAVKQWNMKMYDGLYPSDYRFKYPKAGEENSKVEIKIFDLKSASTKAVKLSADYEYIPNIKWTHDDDQLAVMTTNRHQNNLKINLIDSKTGMGQVIFEEKSDTYLEMPYDVHFTAKEKGFVVLSERSGFRHIYWFNMKGELKQQITKGNWPVTHYYGMDEESGKVYYQSAEGSPLERYVYSIGTDGKKKIRLSKKEGWNKAVFSNGFNYFINYFSTANTPSYISLHESNGKEIRVLEDNVALNNKLKQYQLSKKTFFTIKTEQGHELNAWKILPPNFDEQKKYPVFLTIYGGPGSQTVENSWGGQNYFWHQMLAQKGYIVISVDNRGTGARGVEFKKMTYKQLGKYETEDQIEVAKYMAKQSYVDPMRIGVQGWSYGGYMSSLCLFKGAEYFKAAIAVAPVSNWRFYDSIYTERYMQTPQENPDGYDDNSPINHVEKLKGKYLLVHGTADDNVHFQNTTELIEALVKADKQFDLAIYPNKNHGIYGGNTRYHLYKKMTNFIIENL